MFAMTTLAKFEDYYYISLFQVRQKFFIFRDRNITYAIGRLHDDDILTT